MNWIKKIIKAIKRAGADPCKDIRCRGCAHIDGPICPYPDYCSSMRTCYNCKHSYYGAGPEGCDIHGEISLTREWVCSDHNFYKSIL